ncbi:MAG: TonB-dependent receptor [Candidatus Marinimicrobia bacterium]|jgi:iron complex outermembrane recepter protein|nr:TonB-dependent receptor [Candidatus Neomarinimicrobiota bacterium]MBT4416442.1 TonB-dependent receptor [Flavobacteriaceae bacterium]MBT4959311.1 TonB-dependent receptor [Flavobacteriaceae bacterium]
MKNILHFLLLTITFSLFSQDKITDTIQGTKQNLDEVIVQSIRVKYSSPITHSNISKTELSLRNLGQDLPILLNFLPSVVTTSDAGTGVGYTGIRIRGVSAQSTNITINGIPFNDTESLGTYWVNLPDFTSSIQSLQVQRGVGTSTNGSGAFGASINILTDDISEDPYAEISNSIGSYNTYKNTVKFSTGKINNAFELSGRLSKIKSDGYVDRAFSDLKSYFLQGSFSKGNTLIKALTFGGHEKTYQSWFGLTKNQIIENRRQNPYTYENEIDNYNQDHYQFHWNQKLNQSWSSNVGLNYTYGLGYFEQYRKDDLVDFYGGLILSDIDENGNETGTSDLIRRRWLDNDFFVLNASANYFSNRMNMTFGTFYSNYSGDHFGEIVWARKFGKNTSIRDRYYEGNGKKTDFSFFAKTSYTFNKSVEFYGDLQFRKVDYKTTGLTSDLVNMIIDNSYSFFNPKFGISYKINPNVMFYGSYSRANREPSRSDYESNLDVKPEELNDFELGWRYRKIGLKFNLNVYYMLYNEQLVLSGALDDVGTPIRTNSGSSYRLGIETDAKVNLSDYFIINSSMTISSNKNKQILSPMDGDIFDFGKTNISFSPEFMTSNAIIFKPKDNLKLSVLSKYVGMQYMGNTDALNSKLESYFVNDFNIFYEINPNNIFKSIVFSVLVNNLFDVEYISNGYYYTYEDTWSNSGQVKTLDGAGYYPQATRNFLIGLTLKF